MAHPIAFQRQVRIFREHRGLLRTSQARRLGIHPRDLYGMRNARIIEPVGRGLHRLAGMPPPVNPDLFSVATNIPQGIVCLISALSYHGITTQVPHDVYVALKKGAEKPRLDYPPTRFVWVSEPAFSDGEELHRVDGVPLRIYSPEKTVADCFKFRNHIGLDVAIEALRFWREKRRSRTAVLLKHARLCRVERVMKPYLEAIL